MIKNNKKFFIILIAIIILLQIILQTSNVWASEKSNDKVYIQENIEEKRLNIVQKIAKIFQNLFRNQSNNKLLSNEDHRSGSSAPNPNVTPTPGAISGSSAPNPNVTPTPGSISGSSAPNPNVTPTPGPISGSSAPNPNVTPTPGAIIDHSSYYIIDIIDDWERIGNTFYCFTYTGEEIRPKISVTKYRWSKIYNQYTVSSILKEGIDYELTYSDNTNVGQANINVKGIKFPYTGLNENHYFYIVGKDINKCLIRYDATACEHDNSSSYLCYDGTEKILTISVYDNELKKELSYNEDFTIVYKDNVNAGTATAEIIGIGNYTGTHIESFEISKRKIIVKADEKIITESEDIPELTYIYENSLENQKPEFDGELKVNIPSEIKTGDYDIEQGTLELKTTSEFNANNYELEYQGAKLIVMGEAEPPEFPNDIDDEPGEVEPPEFPNDIDDEPGEADPPEFPNDIDDEPGEVEPPEFPNDIDDEPGEVEPPEFPNDIDDEPGEADPPEFPEDEENVITLTEDMVTLSQDLFAYDGSPKRPTVTVMDGDKKLKKGIDFTVLLKDNTKIGTASVEVTGIGNYNGHVIKYFTIEEIYPVILEEYKTVELEDKICIKEISPNTKIKIFKEKMKINGEIEFYKNGEKIEDDNAKIGTGTIIKIILNNTVKEYTAIVKGDVNGDGEANIIDIMKINLHRLSRGDVLSGIYLEAGKVTMNDSIGVSDILKINRYRLGQIDTL